MSYPEVARQPASVPELKVLEFPPLSTADKDLTLHVTARDARANIERVAILDNGVPIQSAAGALEGAIGTPAYSATLHLQLGAGLNHLQVSSFNSSGTESLRQDFDVILEQQPPERHLLIVAIGVTNYRDVRYELVYPAKDALDFVSLFSNSWKEQLVGTPVLLQDAGANHDAILALKNSVLSKTGIDDEVIYSCRRPRPH
jgi:hypothetical protein